MEDTFTELWPTLIMRRKFPAHEAHKQGLLDFVNDYMERTPESRKASENRNLYESQYGVIPQFYDKVPGVKALADFFVESFIQISSKANSTQWQSRGLDTSKFAIEITGSWFINYLDRGDVGPHIHRNCSWSCAYYLQIGETSAAREGGTYFISPFNKSDSDDWGSIYMAEASRSFQAEEGYAVFFPSFLVHGSHPYDGPLNRIIFSANARIREEK
jgi:hypothetical protein